MLSEVEEKLQRTVDGRVMAADPGAALVPGAASRIAGIAGNMVAPDILSTPRRRVTDAP